MRDPRHAGGGPGTAARPATVNGRTPDGSAHPYARPYADFALAYFEAGWSPLPLPARQKAPVPGDKEKGEHWTGYKGEYADEAQVLFWIDERPHGNIAIRLPDDVVGIDVDDYDDKPGGATLDELEATYGALPPTVRVTARGRRNRSGIRLYRIAPDTRFPTVLGPGIEVIQWFHRYFVAYPSWNPKAEATYRIFDDRRARNAEISEHTEHFTPESLTPLPDEWYEVVGLRREPTGLDKQAPELTNEATLDWLKAHAGKRCRATQNVLNARLAKLEVTGKGGRYDAMLNGVMALVRLGTEGHTGIQSAVGALKKAYYDAIAGEVGRDPTEWDRAVRGAVSAVAGQPEEPMHPAGKCPNRVDDGSELLGDDAAAWVDLLGPDWLDWCDPHLRAAQRQWEAAAEQARRAAFRWITARELAQPVPPIEWLVRQVLTRGTYGPMAGAKKSLKSYTVDDLALAVASGERFLGRFEVVTPGPVLQFVSEGGHLLYQRRRHRLAEAMGIPPEDLGELPIKVTFDIRDLDSAEFRDEVKRQLDEFQPRLVTIDSLYGFHPSDIEVGNVYERGAMLTRLSSLIDGQAALVISDHFNKGPQNLDLDSIAQAGMAAWADSWALQRHRAPAQPDIGRFLLETEFGSRQWGANRWQIDWDLGPIDFLTGEHTGLLSREVRSAAWGGATKSDSNARRETALQIINDEGDFVLTISKLVDKIGGHKDAARKTISEMLDDKSLVIAKDCPAKEGTREVKRDRIGRPGRGAAGAEDPAGNDLERL